MATPELSAGAASLDFLQRAWVTPEPHEILRDEHLGILIVPDLKPAMPEGQVLVVARQDSWEKMSYLDMARFYLAGELVARQLEKAYKLQRGSALTRFGNDSPTPHIICYPRDEVSDGELLHDKARPKATNESLAKTQATVLAQFKAAGFATVLRDALESIVSRQQ